MGRAGKRRGDGSLNKYKADIMLVDRPPAIDNEFNLINFSIIPLAKKTKYAMPPSGPLFYFFGKNRKNFQTTPVDHLSFKQLAE